MYKPDRDAVEEIVASLKQSMSQSIEYLVPWFYSSMPDYYYASTSRTERVEHLHAILTNRVLENKQTAILTSQDGAKTTYIASAQNPRIVSDLCRQLGSRELREGEITTSADGLVLLASFSVDDPSGSSLDDPAAKARIPAIVSAGKAEKITQDEARQFLSRTRPAYLSKSADIRVLRHLLMLRRMDDPRLCRAMAIDFDNTAYKETTRIQIGCHTRNRTAMLLRIGRVLEGLGVRILRGYADSFGMKGNESAYIVSLYVVAANGKQIAPESALRLRIERSLRAAPWAPFDTIDNMIDDGSFLLDEAGFLGAACEYVHQFLGKANRYAYSLENCQAAILRYPGAARNFFEYFTARFDPCIIKPNRQASVAAARKRIAAALDEVTDPLDREILSRTEQFVSQILKTNFFIADKLGLSFRMSPESLDAKLYPEKPYGYFYFFGSHHKGFHVRFRDMARGGVRIVIARTQERYALESSRLFDEAYNLAVAQQLKNKDIPEGGSKCVILLGLDGDRDAAVHATADALLDIILAKADGSLAQPEIVDYYGKEEIIYLGPDENMTPELIVWIVARALARGYRYATAFMSSKPGAGINHKEYGVTSEGVVVYLEHVLAHLGIDPRKQDFSVKLTGGPDGDVGGNALRIMDAKFGKHVKIKGIADGSGSACDPVGLDHGELMRLFKEALPIANFDRKKLSKSKGAFVLDAQGKNSRVRDTLHNTVEADVFLPAGGRPNTINGGNWQQFLLPDGRPSSRAIVEGANLFLTSEARHELENKGVVIIKDSSANKCGVICSSYEVLANLVVEEKEFLAIKREFVRDVISILHERAGAEARLMLSEWEKSGRSKSLIDLSMDVSREINLVTDRVRDFLFQKDSDPCRNANLRKILLDYCPAALSSRYAERIVKQVPRPHQIALLAARIASKIVYQEGLGWLTSAMMDRLPELVQAYLEEERRNQECLDAVRASKLPHKEDILAVLQGAGLRTLVRRKTGMG